MNGEIVGGISFCGNTVKCEIANTCTLMGDVAVSAAISGVCHMTENISGSVVHGFSLQGSVRSEANVVGDISVAHTTPAANYEGDYEVTPKVIGQELKTKHKYMTDDVTVHAIPFFEVSNTSGGNTVYIANEIQIE